MEKIIFGITGLTLGGAERVLVDIANRLIEKYDVTIFTIYSNGELESELNAKVHLISLYNFRYDSIHGLKSKLIPLKVLLSKKRIFKKYIDCEDYKAQIAFLEGPITRIISTKSKNKTKKIAWIHNDISQVFGKGIKSRIKRILDRNIYEKYDTLIFVSMDNLDKFNKVYDDMDLPHETVINNYINSTRILNLSEEKIKKEEEELFNKKEPKFLQVSRLVEQKAVNRLIDAHSKLIRQGYKHYIYVIGDGPLKSSLNEKIKSLNIEETFKLLGARTNPYPYIKRADTFCLFSKFEGYPMVIEEAKILNKYILATNTSAREVLINYPNNSKIVENSEEGIIKGIQYILKDNSIKVKDNYIYKDEIINKIVKTIDEPKREKISKVKLL